MEQEYRRNSVDAPAMSTSGRSILGQVGKSSLISSYKFIQSTVPTLHQLVAFDFANPLNIEVALSHKSNVHCYSILFYEYFLSSCLFSLYQIHLELAKYHELGRFAVSEDTRNLKAALYHLEQSAACGFLESILACARIYLNLPNDILTELHVEVSGRHDLVTGVP